MWNRLPTQFPEREFKEVESSDDEAGDRPQRPWAPPPPRPASANAHFDAVVSHVLSMGKIVISYGKWFDSEPLAPQVTPAKRSRSEAEAETESPNSQAVSAILAASKAVGSNDEVLDVLMAAGRLAPISEHAEDAEMGALVPLNDEELSQASQASQQSQTERPREPTPEDQVPESDEETGTTTPRSVSTPPRSPNHPNAHFAYHKCAFSHRSPASPRPRPPSTRTPRARLTRCPTFGRSVHFLCRDAFRHCGAAVGD